MNLFKQFFEKVLLEDNVASTGGALGSYTSTGGSFPGGADTYAPGDARIPSILGGSSKKPKSRKSKKGKKGPKKEAIHIQRRNLNTAL
tara:strand:+ start:11702 stop:11965 length:264 start_codon:yes stop_codon:yes gene_type:complete